MEMFSSGAWSSIITLAGLVLFLSLFTDMKNIHDGVCPLGTFGLDCRFDCHCVNGTDCIGDVAGCSSGCKPPWTGHECQSKNNALNMTAFQKSGPGSNDPSLAVDGDLSTCSRTKSNASGWWMVDLQEPLPVSRFRIFAENTTSLFDWQVLIGSSSALLSMERCLVLKVYGHRITSVCDGRRTSDRHNLARYVAVLNTRGPTVLCEVQILSCAKFRFGKMCEKECLCRDPREECDPWYGTCRTGCRDGRHGQGCQLECVGTYGPRCMYECGHCVNRSSCDPVSGRCVTPGCDPGWRGPMCDIQCQEGYYGNVCTSLCGHCRFGDVCDSQDGHCRTGCAPGWQGLQCDQGCPSGRHGENCLFTCEGCREGCDSIKGTCPSGCIPGRRGRFCTLECLRGTYGSNCEWACPRCRGGACEGATGACTQGCEQGWVARFCNISCSPGTFGRDCTETCGRCLNGDVCNVTDGACPVGCELGYNGTQCLQECPPGYYGDGCKPCGFCAAQLPCDRLTGKCSEGCVLGYHGETCETETTFVESSNNYLDYILPLNICLVGFTLIFVFACLFVKWRREDIYPYRHSRLPE